MAPIAIAAQSAATFKATAIEVRLGTREVAVASAARAFGLGPERQRVKPLASSAQQARHDR
eukprot:1703043-Pleurochrysis_carterae.AAC.1